jgi:hypothetical protein
MRLILSRPVKKACERPPYAQWARPAGLTNRKASAISEGFSMQTLKQIYG